jgi:hypothetical protein
MAFTVTLANIRGYGLNSFNSIQRSTLLSSIFCAKLASRKLHDLFKLDADVDLGLFNYVCWKLLDPVTSGAKHRGLIEEPRSLV